MNATPRISVLMSVYNGARYLREAVDSILSQTLGDFEFIIVDDGSTDETQGILDSYTDPRVVRLRNETNIGLTRSLNKGLAVACGEYVARQDADDISLPVRLEKQVAFLDAKPNIGLVGTAYREVYDDGRPDRPMSVPLTLDEIREQLLYHHCFCHGSVMARRTALTAVGGYDERFAVAQDRDLWLRLADHFDLANLADELYSLRMSSWSVTGTSRSRQRQAVRRAVQNTLVRGIRQPSAQALGRFYWLQVLDESSVSGANSASDYLNRALAANSALADDTQWLAQAAVSRAFDLARAESGTGYDYEVGFAFLDNLVRLLPADMAALHDHQGWMLSELSAAFAFASAQFGDPTEVRRFCRRAWASHSGHWRDRGLVSVFLRSFIPKLSIASRSIS
ncbi:MAG: glycosyltransferase [Anaerolineae bacterium]|nr:glycosyltransferase [Anaerolineae bacterium]